MRACTGKLVALRRRGGTAWAVFILTATLSCMAIFVAGIARDHLLSVQEVTSLRAALSPGDSKQTIREQLELPAHDHLRLHEASDREWHIGVLTWPANWMLVLEFGVDEAVQSIRVRAVDGPQFTPAGAPPDRTR